MFTASLVLFHCVLRKPVCKYIPHTHIYTRIRGLGGTLLQSKPIIFACICSSLFTLIVTW